MLSSEIVAWGTPNCGKGQPGQIGHTGHPAAPGRFRNVRVRGAGVTQRVEDLAQQVLDRVLAASPRRRGRGVGRPHPPGAHPLRQLGDPPERRRGRRSRVGIRVHVDGRTATARRRPSSARTGSTASCRASLAAAALAPLDAGWPGVAPPAGSRDVAAGRPGDPRRLARTTGRRSSRDFVDAAGGLETAGYCRTNHWQRRVRQLGRSGGRRRERRGRPRRHRPPRRRRRRRPAGVGPAGRHRRGGPRRSRRGEGERRRRPDRDPARPLRGRARADGRRRHPRGARRCTPFNAKAVAERRSFVRLGDAQFDPAITLVDDAPVAGVPYDAEGTPTSRVVLVDGGITVGLTHDRRTAAAAGDARSRPATASGRRRSAAIARHLVLAGSAPGDPAAEVDGPVVDAADRRARRRRRARRARHRLLVHPGARSADAGRSPG